MATHEIPIAFVPDASGDVFPEPMESALTLGTATFGTTECVTILAPTGTDIGVYFKIPVPQNYVGSPAIVIRGVIAQAASTLAFGVQQVSREDSESVDVAYEAEDTASNATWTGYAAEDQYEESVALTPTAAYVAGDTIYGFCYRDDSVDTQTGEFHLTELLFSYSDA